MFKKNWNRPLLTVMARSKPDETMQAGDCKHPTIPAGPGPSNNECDVVNDCKKICASQNNKS